MKFSFTENAGNQNADAGRNFVVAVNNNRAEIGHALIAGCLAVNDKVVMFFHADSLALSVSESYALMPMRSSMASTFLLSS